jgi:hypothetical protein
MRPSIDAVINGVLAGTVLALILFLAAEALR